MRTTNMNSNNLTAILTALAIVPLYFKEPSQAAPEKWDLSASFIGDTGDMLKLIAPSQHNGTTARRGPTGEWVVSRKGNVLSRHNNRDDAAFALYEMLIEAEREVCARGWEPFQVDHIPLGSRTYYRRRIE